MILESMITNITSDLDMICQQDSKGISSHEKLKEQALNCLINMIESAPNLEYKNLVQSKHHEIILGYLLNILCRLAERDKSRSIRLQAIQLIDALVKRLDSIHRLQLSEECSIMTLIFALPRVSSMLLKIPMSDTKLPKTLLVTSVQTLGRLLCVTFSTCDHLVPSHLMDGAVEKLNGKNLIDTCDNLAQRIGLLVNHVITNSGLIHQDVKQELLSFCLTLVTQTRSELLTRTLRPIVRYLAFISSTLQDFGYSSTKVELELMLLSDSIRMQMQDSHSQDDHLDEIALKFIFELMDELEANCFSMLISERQSNLAMLCGLLKLLTEDVLTTLLEMSNRLNQLLGLLTKLVEFSSEQPFLFLTNGHIELGALERRGENIYTIEKRFLHLTEKEVIYIDTCCHILGQVAEWSFLCDIVKSVLMKFQSANNLYITMQVLKGCLNRCSENAKPCRLTSQLIEWYIENIQANCIEINDQDESGGSYSHQVLKTVIAIETAAIILELHVKFVQHCDRRVVILRDLLCPLLYWCSSSSRAISEAALNSLTQIGQLYGHTSSQSFIAEYIDYIVNGAAMMMENFFANPEVVDVIAVTFRLSSMKEFYYFSDVYERVFKVLRKYHHTKKSKSIALLFLRTLTILNDWLDARDGDGATSKARPLDTREGISSVLREIEFDRRIARLQQEIADAAKLNEAHVVTEEDEQKIREQIERGDVTDGDMQKDEDPTEDEHGDGGTKKKVKPEEMVLTEKILKHCIGLMHSNHTETKILAIKAAAHGLRLLRRDEDALLPLAHQIWTPLLSRLTDDYDRNLEVNLCAFECLTTMAMYSKDFIRRRTLDTIIPRLCLFLESQASQSLSKTDYGPFCMTVVYKCQLKILTDIGQLAYHTNIAYSNLWRIVRAVLRYVDERQVPSLRKAALNSMNFLIALDPDCVWYHAKQSRKLTELPFGLIFEQF